MTATEVTSYIPVALSVVGGIVGSILVPAISAYLKNRRDDFVEVTTQQKAFSQQLLTQVGDLQTKVEAQHTEITRLHSRVHHLESIVEHEIPLPMWSKDRNHVYMWVNLAFETDILIPMGKKIEDVIGKTDSDVWGEEKAKELRLLDSRSMSSHRGRAFQSGFQFTLDGYYYSLCKWPLMAGSVHVGWMTSAMEETEHCDGK